MDWKEENPRKRYIDDITLEEATKIAHLAAGMPEEFEIIKIDARCNGNNIPHVEIHYKYLEVVIFEEIETYAGIFHNLNVYLGEHFHSPYCQKEIFKAFEEFGFE